MSPQRHKERTFSTLWAQLEGLARQPVLTVFEDVHWIDPTSLEMLALIVERVSRLRVLLVITARPEFTPPWPANPHLTNIAIARLSRRECAALVERICTANILNCGLTCWRPRPRPL
jgi:predicted ATPase